MIHGFLLMIGTLRAVFLSQADLVLENLALRQQLAMFARNRQRPRIVAADRLFWLALRRIWLRWSDVLVFVKPETVVRWHQTSFRRYWTWLSRRRRRGRPPIEARLCALIHRMALENPTWGAPRIHGGLRVLGFEVSERSVSRWLPRRRPPPGALERWLTFLRNHRGAIAAMDFSTVPTATFRVLYVWFAIAHSQRRILHLDVTEHPTASWVVQQLREAFPYDTAPHYLVFDRDAIFSARVVSIMKSLGIRPARTAYRSPWQKGKVESSIGHTQKTPFKGMRFESLEAAQEYLNPWEAKWADTRIHGTTKPPGGGDVWGGKTAPPPIAGRAISLLSVWTKKRSPGWPSSEQRSAGFEPDVSSNTDYPTQFAASRG